jgi:hypothetical protein
MGSQRNTLLGHFSERKQESEIPNTTHKSNTIKDELNHGLFQNTQKHITISLLKNFQIKKTEVQEKQKSDQPSKTEV